MAEPSSDGTCRCMVGYERKDGVCTKKYEEQKKCTGVNEMAEPSSDGTCRCMVGYERKNGKCVSSSESGNTGGSTDGDSTTTNPDKDGSGSQTDNIGGTNSNTD